MRILNEGNHKFMERTLLILKPDAVQRQIVGDIITRFEHIGLRIVGCKMIDPSRDHYHEHYEGIGNMVTRRGEDAFNVTLDLMKEGPVIALVLEGIEAVEIARKLVGPTEPKEAAPGTIRGDYAHVSLNFANTNKVAISNLVHASGDIEEAKQEIKHWFSDEELFEYKTVHDRYTLRGVKKD